jgi:hypothetical protein
MSYRNCNEECKGCMRYENRKNRCTKRENNLSFKKGNTPLYDIGPLSWTVFINIIYKTNYRLFSLFLSGQYSQSKCVVVFVLLTFKNLASYIQDGHTATLQMLYFIFFSANISTKYFKHAAHSRFSLQNAVYFIMLPFFGSCIIHILHTECAKI